MDFYALLKATSRSFYLGITGLRQPLRDQVCYGYLFCRLLDIFEDASECAPEARQKLLSSLRVVLSQVKQEPESLTQSIEAFEADRQGLSPELEPYFLTHEYERPLFDGAAQLLRAIGSFPLPVRAAFSSSLMDMALGMESELQESLSRPPRWERSREDFDQYCYTVAGTVGIFLSRIFWNEGVFVPKAQLNDLEKWGESFGKALQVVNITKDLHRDWKEGRCYWPGILAPGGVGTSAPPPEELEKALDYLSRSFEKYRAEAQNYIDSLSTSRGDVRFFCDFPLQMADKTMVLALGSRGWLQDGSSPKVSRTDTLLLMQKLSLIHSLPALWRD